MGNETPHWLAPTNVQQHPASIDAYIRQGWSLCAIPLGSKGPNTKGWEKPENSLKAEAYLPSAHGVGLCHAQSGTMALDIDYWDDAKTALAEAGIDLDQLYNAPDAVQILSGKQGHGKLLYRMPGAKPLRSKKLINSREDGSKYNYLDFRCASANGSTMQDVLPPTIHPETNQPYQWGGYGHWTRIPEIPPALLKFWESLVQVDEQRSISTPACFNTSWQEIQAALEHIGPDCSREEWLSIGMALHWAGSQCGGVELAYYVWNEWSKGTSECPAVKYDINHLNRTWKSFKADGGIAIGTLFDIAKRYGFKRSTPSADEMFADVNTGSIHIDTSNPLAWTEDFKVSQEEI